MMHGFDHICTLTFDMDTDCAKTCMSAGRRACMAFVCKHRLFTATHLFLHWTLGALGSARIQTAFFPRQFFLVVCLAGLIYDTS